MLQSVNAASLRWKKNFFNLPKFFAINFNKSLWSLFLLMFVHTGRSKSSTVTWAEGRGPYLDSTPPPPLWEVTMVAFFSWKVTKASKPRYEPEKVAPRLWRIPHPEPLPWGRKSGNVGAILYRRNPVSRDCIMEWIHEWMNELHYEWNSFNMDAISAPSLVWSTNWWAPGHAHHYQPGFNLM